MTVPCKTVVCLANSRKTSGRCVAGKELNQCTVGPWVRPVSARPHQEVSLADRQYKGGSDPQLLDIISIPILTSANKGFQTENILFNPSYYWEKVGQVSPNDLPAFLDPVCDLWINGFSTYNGENDRIPTVLTTTLTDSLRLIQVESVRIRVFAPSATFGNQTRRVLAEFQHFGKNYRLWVTDPIQENKYLSMNDGLYHIDRSFLTVSLGEHTDGYCYKFVAAIIPI